MILNQQSHRHSTCQEEIACLKFANLELVPDKPLDLELCTGEVLRRTQEELLWYRRLYENLPSIYFTLDVEGKILSINDFGAVILGYTPEDLYSKLVFDLFESDRQRLIEALAGLSRPPAAEATNWEFRLDNSSGNIVWVKIAARLLKGKDQAVILMICEDITDHKVYEDALHQSEERFHTMADTIPVMLWMAGQNSLCTFFNQYWLEFRGRSMQEELGLGWVEGIHPEDRILCLTTYHSALNAQAKFQLEYRLRRRDGVYRWILNTGVPQFMPNGNFAGYISSCIDITERKLAEVALEESQQATQTQLEEMETLNRLKNEFLSTVSHELRTPLSNMKMAIQMLGIALNREQDFFAEIAKPEADKSKVARYFQILDKECDREINLINNFLDLQRLDVGIKPLVLENITVKQWLLRVVGVFNTRNRNSQHHLHVEVADNLPPIVSDPFGLERILIELLTNACKFSPAGEEILITALLKSTYMQIQVINTGVEIPTNELSRIFDKFYRIPSNDPWKQGGTGLGLALVKKITTSLGGTIAVESQCNRTCFTIELPI